MTTIRYIITLFALVTLVSCGKTDTVVGGNDTGTGYMRFEEVTADSSTHLKPQYPGTRSVEDGNFWIKIKSVSQDSYVAESLKSQIADLLEIRVGEYLVEAVYPTEPKNVAFEQPIYYGVTDSPILIEKDKITTVSSITTMIQNMKVTVVFSENVKSLFDTYSATVSNTKGELVFDQATTIAGYYNVEELKVKFNGVRAVSGEKVSFVFDTPISNIGKAYHHNVIVDAQYSYEPRTKTANINNNYTHEYILSIE